MQQLQPDANARDPLPPGVRRVGRETGQRPVRTVKFRVARHRRRESTEPSCLGRCRSANAPHTANILLCSGVVLMGAFKYTSDRISHHMSDHNL